MKIIKENVCVIISHKKNFFLLLEKKAFSFLWKVVKKEFSHILHNKKVKWVITTVSAESICGCFTEEYVFEGFNTKDI